jgi:tetratricopeptide (TPR) repeat protein
MISIKRLPSSLMVLTMVLTMLLGGCGVRNPFVKETTDSAATAHVTAIATLAELQPAIVEPAAKVAQKVTIDEVITSYTDLVGLAEDPDIKMKGLQRLADLRLEKGEVSLYEGLSGELDMAAEAYQGLLEQYPDRIENDRVQYQLAKTRDLQGNTEANLAVLNSLVLAHPDSPYIAETQFRRGDMLFSQGDFVGAKDAFDQVIASGEKQFLTNAWYMRGWCYFKLDDYRQALISFTSVLDVALPSDFQMASLEEQNATLVEDLLRVMGFAFTYLGGAQSIPELFAETGPKPYEFLVYDRYAQLLAAQELYTDAVDVYRKYIELYPHSPYAPQYQVSIIKTLTEAGFVSSILEEKSRFVDVYGKDSEFWLATDPVDLQYTQARLEEYLPELAAIHYNLGQRAASPLDAGKQYELSAKYYAAYADTFPQQPKTAEMLFLLGESLGHLRRWEEGITPWEMAGYDYPDYERASEAAYASVLAYGKVIESMPPEAQDDSQMAEARLVWQERQLRSRLMFVDRHAEDPRALEVLYLTASERFTGKYYQDVLGFGQRVLDWQPPPSPEMQVDARLLRAHSFFALEEYMQAETAYLFALEVMSPDDSRRAGVTENLAASVYKQGEGLLAAGNKDLAVNEFLRVALVAPTSQLRLNAEYDAANLLLEMQQWDAAVPVLIDFRKRYPDHALADSVPGKLALAYQESGNFKLAAGEFALMVAVTQDLAERRERLLITAELYDKAADTGNAIKTYSEYANVYEQPVEEYMEVVARLAALYAETGQTEKQRFWLKKEVAAYEKNAATATDRMRYLAASSASVLADDSYQSFRQTRLSLPLNKSLTRKTGVMKETMAAYKNIAAYGVAEFATLAGYRMGDIYAQLSADLMNSERPANLSEMELEQYELLLEEQAYPFEENAIAIHEQNIQKSWNGIYDDWVKSSFEALSKLLPARYGKAEQKKDVTDVIL